MEMHEELSLAVGDAVVYASHGVGRVTVRREKSVVVEFRNSALTVTFPIEWAVQCMRPLSTSAEIVGVGRTLRSDETDSEANWQRRLKANRAKVTSGKAVALAEVVRDAGRRDERASSENDARAFSLAERQLYLKARRLLAEEIGVSRGIDAAHADEWIGEQITLRADQDSLPAKRDLQRPSVALEPIAAPSGKRARRRGRM